MRTESVQELKKPSADDERIAQVVGSRPVLANVLIDFDRKTVIGASTGEVLLIGTRLQGNGSVMPLNND